MLAQGGCSSGKLFRKELVFTHDELQKRVEKEFPLKRKKSLLKVEFSDPAVLSRRRVQSHRHSIGHTV